LGETAYEQKKLMRVIGVLRSMSLDIKAGYLKSLEELIHGDVFADFLDMALHLLDSGYKDAAAVVAGSTLEAHLRQMAKVAGLDLEVTTPKGTYSKGADQLNSEPERVAGLVLVDARHEATGERFAAAGVSENPPWVAWIARLAPVAAYVGIARVVGFSPGPTPDAFAPSVRAFARATRFRSSAFASGADELESATESAEQVKLARRVLDIPLVVVSAGRRRNAKIAEVLDSLQSDQLSVSKLACQVIAARSGHGIVFQQPEIVVDAVRATVYASRQGGVAPNCGTVAQRGS
jgi:hypothetical protein